MLFDIQEKDNNSGLKVCTVYRNPRYVSINGEYNIQYPHLKLKILREIAVITETDSSENGKCAFLLHTA